MPERTQPRQRRLAKVAAGAGLLALLMLFLLPHLHHRRPHHPPPHHRVRIVSLAGDDLQLRSHDGWAKTVRIDDKTFIHEGPHRKLDRSSLRADLNIHEHDHLQGDVYVVDDLDIIPGQLKTPPEEEARQTWPWVLASGALTAGLATLIHRRRR